MEPMTVLARFPRVMAAFPARKWDGEGGWDVPCPCEANHRRNDKRWSGRLWMQGDRLRYWCGRGCKWLEVVAATGTIKTDWFVGAKQMGEEQQRRVVARYDYVDYDGTPLFQVCRTDPKGFFQRRPGPNGKGWVYQLREGHVKWHEPPGRWDLCRKDEPGAVYVPPCKMVLYNHLDITKRKDQPILIVEGEKSVDALKQIGYVATCSPLGAGKWRSGYGGILSGRDIVVFPDNDEAGEDHAGFIIGSALLYGANSVRVVRSGVAGYTLPTGGDVFDWLLTIGDTRQGEMKVRAERYEAIKRLVRSVRRFSWYDPPPEANRAQQAVHKTRMAAHGRKATQAVGRSGLPDSGFTPEVD